jgi:two-component system OmpR family response regulator
MGAAMEQMPHILVVDDDREIRELLARFLERHRLRVTAVRDGREARRAWTQGHYHLVVLDLMLPGESGLDLARWLRTQADTPIVMLTAMGEETDRIIGLELGADDYVPKPCCAAPARRRTGGSRAAARRRCASTAGRWNRRGGGC